MAVAAIIPVHNRPRLVAEAIASIQRQTLAVDEIIVVDDVSTDDTRAVVLALAAADARIRLIELDKNEGASNARNIGAGATGADWLAFLDSDDAWLPEKHALQRASLDAAPGAIASFTGIRYVPPNGAATDVPAPATITLDDLRELNWLGSTSTALISHAAFDAAGGFDTSLPSCQDWDLWLRLGRLGALVTVSEPLLLYSQSDAVRISSNLGKVIAGHEIVFARAIEGATEAGRRRKIRAYHRLRLAQILLWDFKQPGKAIAAIAGSFALRPTRMGLHLGLSGLKALLS